MIAQLSLAVGTKMVCSIQFKSYPYYLIFKINFFETNYEIYISDSLIMYIMEPHLSESLLPNADCPDNRTSDEYLGS